MKDWEMTRLRKNERGGIKEADRRLKQYYPVQKIILYGSKARGDSDEYSDIDILLISSCRKSDYKRSERQK